MRKVRLYDKSAQVYHQRYLRIQRAKYQAVVPFLQEGPLLDMGVGTGIGLSSIIEFAPVVGVDGSVEMLRIALQNVQESKGWKELIFLVCASAETLPFRDHLFSTVVSITVIQNLKNYQKGVDEMQRVSQVGGLLAVTTLARVLSLQQLESILNSSIKLIARFEQIANEDQGLIFQKVKQH